MKLLKALGAVIVGAASILGGFGTFAQWAGIEFGGAAGVVIGAAPAWLPIASFAFGIALGWFARGKRSGGERIAFRTATRLACRPSH